MAHNDGWIGVDLDGTTAHYDGWVNHIHVGKPIEVMVYRIRDWVSRGIKVRIFTARVFPLNMCIDAYDFKYPVEFLLDAEYRKSIESVRAIQDWCLENIGHLLPVTNVKDYGMIQLWDDRAVAVECNTGNIKG
jgi:hypothetical protein